MDFLSNLSLSLAVQLSDGEGRRPRFARVKVPPSLPRFVPLSGGPLRSSTEFVLLEDLIESHLDDLAFSLVDRRERRQGIVERDEVVAWFIRND